MWWTCCFCGATVVKDFSTFTHHQWDEDNTKLGSFGAGANNFDDPSFFDINTCNHAARWTNVTIPNAATISTATVLFASSSLSYTFQSIGSGASGSDDLKIIVSAHDHDNSPASVSAADWETRSRTTANTIITQTEDGLSTRVLGATDMNALNVTSAVQEVVNRAGWSSGNALTIIVDDNGSDFGDEGNANRWGVNTGGSQMGDTLHVEYS